MTLEMLRRRMDAAVGVPLLNVWSAMTPRRERPTEFRRLLVIKLAAAGDTILLIPALRALRRALPEARIDWLVSPINLSIARTVPYVDDRIVVERKSPLALIGLARKLRSRDYDAAIDFEQWAYGTAVLALASGAPVRLGFDTPGQSRTAGFTDSYRKDFVHHEVEEFLGLAARLVPLDTDPTLELWETDTGTAEIDKLSLKQRSGPRVLLHPGCGSDGRPREWPLARFAVLADWMIQKYGAELFITSGPEERKKSADLSRFLHGRAHDLGGRLSWLGLISLVGRMDLVVSGNTGVMHVAAALKRPQVALHGPTNPALWGPVNPQARVVQSSCPSCPCLRLGYEYHRTSDACMAMIEVDEVKQAVSGLFDEPAGSDRNVNPVNGYNDPQ